MKINKKYLLIFLGSFLIYFSLGLIFTYYLGLFKYWNVLFDFDTPRVFGDMSIINYNHYRTSVHPLFVLIFQPITIILTKLLVGNAELSILLLQCIFGAISVVIVKFFFDKLKLSKKTSNVLTLIFALSFSQIVFTSNIETYIFAQLFLILLWLFVLLKIDKELHYYDYIIIVLLGIASLAVTITNFVQFVIAILFLITFNKNIKKRFLTTAIILFIVMCVSVTLADIQNIVWPSAPNFFTKMIQDIKYGNGEEKLYIDYTINTNKILNVINSNYADVFNLGKLYVPQTGIYLTFQNMFITTFISCIMFAAFVILNIVFIVKNKFNIKKHKLYYGLLLSYLANLVLHLFYGNGIAFLYICHYNFLIFFIAGYIFKNLNIKVFNNNVVYYLTIIIYILLSLRMIISMFILLFPLYNHLEHIRLLPILIISLDLCLITMLIVKNKYLKIGLPILVILTGYIFYRVINTPKTIDLKNCDEFCSYNIKLDKYKSQLKEMKNSFMVSTYQDRNKPLNVMFFGMADRKKMVYKDGKIYDALTREVIKKISYEEELIIPNEYTVLLKDKDNNIYRIVENEEGVFLFKNKEKTVLTTSKGKIEFPNFNDYTYSEVLKVLYQEILFNIKDDEPLPNIFGYSQAYYRDAMLITMVLEETNSLSLITPWVKRINKIYDNSRSLDIDEPDNLGELLYIINASGVNRDDLINRILKEINNKKDKNGYISGLVNGTNQTYYPTILAIFGAKKGGIETGLSMPTVDDGYARLTWYSDYKVATKNEQNVSYFPYINWAFYHYSRYGKLYILDELYPLSYEGGDDNPDSKVENECFISDFYCKKDLYLSHAWTASEMFLMLIDY